MTTILTFLTDYGLAIGIIANSVLLVCAVILAHRAGIQRGIWLERAQQDKEHVKAMGAAWRSARRMDDAIAGLPKSPFNIANQNKNN